MATTFRLEERGSPGASRNNGPTLSDIYNSTPTWAFPHADSATVMPAAGTLVDITLASQVGGVTAYGLWDDSWYGEFGVYRTAKRGFFRFMGQNDPTETVVDGLSAIQRSEQQL